MIKRIWQVVRLDEDDVLPRDRPEALIDLLVVTPFTVLRRVANVVLGPSRVRRLDDWIDGKEQEVTN